MCRPEAKPEAQHKAFRSRFGVKIKTVCLHVALFIRKINKDKIS